MRFFMPVKLYHEADCVKKHSALFAAAGTKALVVTGRHSAGRNGSLSDVTAALEAEGIALTLFDRVEENPSIETVMEAVKTGRQEKADFVIGIGGGSPMDAAKAAALLLHFPKEGADFLYDANAAAEAAPHAPLILIPTTCGSGSEATETSVLTVHKRRTKISLPHKIFADAALIDGKYLEGAPIEIIRSTAVDALAHLWESALNSSATPYSRMCAEAGLCVWGKIKDALLSLEERSLTTEERNLLMQSSAMAGMAIAQTGTSLPHALSYALTYDLHIPHGMAVGFFEAGYLEQVTKEERQKVLRPAGFSSVAEWKEYYQVVCGRLVIPGEELQRTMEMVASNPGKMAKAPFACTEAVLRRVVYG